MASEHGEMASEQLDDELRAASCRAGHLEHARLCLDSGTDINRADPRLGNAPLHIACAAGHVDVVQLCLDRGVSSPRGPERYAASL
mmetsp:Transcript_4068/g.12705  ORF Transcript_4068/g.12705 Transcript_4068/m.12705 type:complete len:86 (+) Transcript_4068:309-566(+)